MLTEREHEIEIFKPEEFWTLNVIFKTENNSSITSNIFQLDGKKVDKFSFRKNHAIIAEIGGIKKKIETVLLAEFFFIKNIKIVKAPKDTRNI